MVRIIPTLGLLSLVVAGGAFAADTVNVPSKARIEFPPALVPLPTEAPPSCTLTASPNPIVMTTSAYDVGLPTTTVTLRISTGLDTGYVFAGRLFQRDYAIPYSISPGQRICGGGNPPTVGFNNDASRRLIQNLSVPAQPIQTFSVTMKSGSSQFVAELDGPGGTGTCQLQITVQCAPIMTNSMDWTNLSGTYSSFNFDDGYFMVNNDPPYCTWSLCQIDGYGDPYPGCCGNRGHHPGCFAPDAQILLANGLSKSAGTVVAGDELWNPVRKKAVKVKKVISGPEKLPLIELGFGSSVVRVTTKHPMRTREGLKPADSVTRADWLLAEDGTFRAVTTLRRLPLKSGQVVYNFNLVTSSPDPSEHMLVADGIVTGDYFLQAQLEKVKKKPLH